MVNFSRINNELFDRKIGQMVRGEKGEELNLKVGETSAEKRDLFNVYSALLIPLMWQKIMPDLEKVNIKIDLNQGEDMHTRLFHAYPSFVQEFEHNYINGLRDAIVEKQGKVEDLNKEEIYFFNCFLNNPYEGVPNISSLDALHFFIHLSEVVATLTKDAHEFERTLNSKNVQIFMTSLLMNDRDAILMFMGIFGNRKGFMDIDSEEYHFDKELFYFDESRDFRVRSDILEKMKDYIKANTTEKDVRYCPALWAGDTVQIIFKWIRTELVKQYQNNWDRVKK